MPNSFRNYFDAILRGCNRFGRRDNKYKARIKILVRELSPAEFTRQVEAWQHLEGGPGTVPPDEIERLAAHFTAPPYRALAGGGAAHRSARADSRPFARWVERNVRAHQRPGYASVVVSLKRTGTSPRRRDGRRDGRARRPCRP